MPARTIVTRGGDAAHGSELARRAPHPALAGAVVRYVGFEERSPRPLVRRELPQDSVPVIVNLGAPIAVAGVRHGSFVAPLDDRFADTELPGTSRGVEVLLSPFAARALLGVPLGELDALAVDLDALLGRDAALLAERLDAAPDWDARFALLDATLGARLAAAAGPPADVVRAWARLRATGGTVRVAALARELGCSRRHLVARFREHVGPPPKTVARIMRFRRLLRGLDAEPGSLAALAQACGYYDQAHLNREFRELAGTTPTAHLAARDPSFPFVQAEPVGAT